MELEVTDINAVCGDGWGCVESQAYSSTFLGFVDVDCEVVCGDYSGDLLE